MTLDLLHGGILPEWVETGPWSCAESWAESGPRPRSRDPWHGVRTVQPLPKMLHLGGSSEVLRIVFLKWSVVLVWDWWFIEPHPNYKGGDPCAQCTGAKSERFHVQQRFFHPGDIRLETSIRRSNIPDLSLKKKTTRPGGSIYSILFNQVSIP